MGFIAGIKLEGVEEVKRQLAKDTNALISALPDALLKSGSVIEVSAKEKAPVRTGALRDSIITEVETTGSSITVTVGPTVDYADDVEFGGVRRPAKPYLRPAADEMEDAALQALVDELNKVVEGM